MREGVGPTIQPLFFVSLPDTRRRAHLCRCPCSLQTHPQSFYTLVRTLYKNSIIPTLALSAEFLFQARKVAQQHASFGNQGNSNIIVHGPTPRYDRDLPASGAPVRVTRHLPPKMRSSLPKHNAFGTYRYRREGTCNAHPRTSRPGTRHQPAPLGAAIWLVIPVPVSRCLGRCRKESTRSPFRRSWRTIFPQLCKSG